MSNNFTLSKLNTRYLRVCAILLFFIGIFLGYDEAKANASHDATILTHTIPLQMRAGTSYTVSITVKNSGTYAWSESVEVRLGGVGDYDPLAHARQVIDDGRTIYEGQIYTFQFQMTAPLTTGTYRTDWRMVHDGYAWFGDVLTLDVEVVDTIPDYASTLMFHTIPDKMRAGLNYPVAITLRNDGALTWNETQKFRLGAMNDSDPFTYTRRVLPAGISIATGQTFTFQLTLEAPYSAGTYTTDWMMVHEWVSWFGSALVKNVEVEKSYNYDYDARGYLVNLSDGTHRIEQAYDLNGNLVGKRSTTSILDNGTFESGRFWTNSSHINMAGNAWFEGIRSMMFNGNNVYAQAAVSELIDVEPNTMYILSGWIENGVTSGSFYIDYIECDEWGNAIFDGPGISSESGQGWQYRDMTFTTSHSTKKLMIRIVADVGTSGWGNVDNVELKPFMANGSFEGDNGWNLTYPCEHFTTTNTMAYEGLRSLQFLSNQAQTCVIHSIRIPVSSNKSYAVQAAIRDQAISGHFFVDVLAFDEKMNMVIDGTDLYSTLRGSGHWQVLYDHYVTNQATKYLVVRIYAYNVVGQVNVDQIIISGQ